MPKILIAEDEPDIRELVAFTLRFGSASGGRASVNRSTTGAARYRACPPLPKTIQFTATAPTSGGNRARKLAISAS